jgi:type I restriction enzyme S subunit
MTAVPLKSLCQIRHGGTPSKANAAYWVGSIPWVSPKDMKATMLSDASDHISQEAVENSATSVVPEKSILVVVRSGILAHSLPVAQAAKPLAFNQDIKALTPDDAKVDPDYLFWFIRAQEPHVLTRGVKKGATVHSLQSGFIENLQVPLPARDEQRRIVDLLSRAEGIVRLRREAEKKAAELIPALFLDMFGDPATNPKGWQKAPLTAACGSSDDIKCGPFGTQLAKSEFCHEGIPLWGIKHVNVGFSIPTVEFLSTEKAEELSMYSIVPGDIVMTRKGTIGNCALYRDGMPHGVMHSDLLRIRPDRNRCSSQFLSDQLHISRDVEYQIARTASSGAVMPGINVGRLKSVQILIPPMETQHRYEEKIELIHSIQSQQSAAIVKAQAIFDALLASSFS